MLKEREYKIRKMVDYTKGIVSGIKAAAVLCAVSICGTHAFGSDSLECEYE